MQTRAQEKAQANTPSMPNAQPSKQKTTPKTTSMPIQTEERKGEFEALPSRMVQQLPRNNVLPPELMLPAIVMPPRNRPPPKPPNIDETNTDSHQGPGPRMDIEENSPHQEGIRLVNTSNFIQKHLS